MHDIACKADRCEKNKNTQKNFQKELDLKTDKSNGVFFTESKSKHVGLPSMGIKHISAISRNVCCGKQSMSDS